MDTNAQYRTQIANPNLQIAETLKIDVRAQRVWKGAQELHLARLEYEVLEYLVRRPGWLVKYEELWREVWKQTIPLGECEQRTVRQVVKRIRNKLGETCDNPHFLECVRKCGFRCIEKAIVVLE